MVTVTAVPTGDAQDHHGSHRDLLRTGAQVKPEPIDAVIVPTARPPAYLDEAARLAGALNCTLVTLHSKQWTSAEMAAERLPSSADLIAIDVPDVSQLRLPAWETARYQPWKIFPKLPNFPRTDLSAKRNLGLMLARLLGWSRIMFVDDDITKLDAEDVGRASGLLDTYNAVGLHICGFHDHSVVCHAFRDAGGPQVSFIGGGALVVQAERSTSFFPEIYNDDWFFLLDGDKGLQPSAVMGRCDQYPYDPFRPERARAEEFGEVLAEGIYWLLDQERSLGDADREHWTKYLSTRKQFIERVLTMVAQAPDLRPADRARRIEALKESLGRLKLITPALCENYLLAWQEDRQAWERHIRDLPTDLRRVRALETLTRDGAPLLNWRLRRRGRAAGTRYPVTAMRTVSRPLPQAPRSGELLPVGAEQACFVGRAAP